jgi:GxxExxY protein
MNKIEIEEQLKKSLENTSGGWTGSLDNQLTGAIIESAIAVHRELGPGKLESVYQRALEIELGARGIPYRKQVPIEMLYRGESVGDFFADLIVDRKVLVELKAVDALRSVHRAQVLSYLRATGLELGLLINFNVRLLKDGVRRLIQTRVAER